MIGLQRWCSWIPGIRRWHKFLWYGAHGWGMCDADPFRCDGQPGEKDHATTKGRALPGKEMS